MLAQQPQLCCALSILNALDATSANVVGDEDVGAYTGGTVAKDDTTVLNPRAPGGTPSTYAMTPT